METVATSGTSAPQQTSSVDEVAWNDDLLMGILIHLPIISLLKLRSISQRLFSLISSPYFYRLQNPNLLTTGLFLPISSASDVVFVSLDGDGRPSTPSSLSFPDDPNSGVTILQSCNGLLLCSSRKLGEDSKQQMYFLFNPTTRQSIQLPKLLDDHPVVAVSIAFDPSKSIHYKVVCVRRNCNSVMSDCYRIEIYSSESGSWMQSGDVFTAPDHQFDHGVFWNGAIHWINNSWTRRIGDLGSILPFDVNEERLGEMPMPEIPHDWKQVKIRYFGESRNHLQLILHEDPSSLRFNVYEMQKDHSRWFLKHQVDLVAVATAFPEMRHWFMDPANLLGYNCSILCFVRGENDDDSFLVLCIPGKVICYRLKDKTFTKLCDFGFPFKRWQQRAYQYIECLVCVK